MQSRLALALSSLVAAVAFAASATALPSAPEPTITVGVPLCAAQGFPCTNTGALPCCPVAGVSVFCNLQLGTPDASIGGRAPTPATPATAVPHSPPRSCTYTTGDEIVWDNIPFASTPADEASPNTGAMLRRRRPRMGAYLTLTPMAGDYCPCPDDPRELAPLPDNCLGLVGVDIPHHTDEDVRPAPSPTFDRAPGGWVQPRSKWLALLGEQTRAREEASDGEGVDESETQGAPVPASSDTVEAAAAPNEVSAVARALENVVVDDDEYAEGEDAPDRHTHRSYSSTSAVTAATGASFFSAVEGRADTPATDVDDAEVPAFVKDVYEPTPRERKKKNKLRKKGKGKKTRDVVDSPGALGKGVVETGDVVGGASYCVVDASEPWGTSKEFTGVRRVAKGRVGKSRAKSSPFV
ncbi:uncharacterized protein BXZ73DRAFT_75281 [Epithele typhae]|uniref:uncharacterized protein n=1 Tax=Epithele typhae TaxID=378194 RepID=UPI0020078F14|nr:uncharacterized protein BXZ73DRAFT_75281 [Epithele typhae]KAH9940726.1 hypothetical protein BXZ73DRAFT_75281 [Epithele typhae]